MKNAGSEYQNDRHPEIKIYSINMLKNISFCKNIDFINNFNKKNIKNKIE